LQRAEQRIHAWYVGGIEAATPLRVVDQVVALGTEVACQVGGRGAVLPAMMVFREWVTLPLMPPPRASAPLAELPLRVELVMVIEPPLLMAPPPPSAPLLMPLHSAQNPAGVARDV
jgi:hypothetical protein